MRAFIKKHGRKIVLTILFLALLGWVTSYFSVFLSSRKSFATTEELIEYVESPNTLWRGTRYAGDQDGNSVFLHHSFGHEVLEIPADSWDPPKRFQLTVNRGRWIEWNQCFSREDREKRRMKLQ